MNKGHAIVVVVLAIPLFGVPAAAQDAAVDQSSLSIGAAPCAGITSDGTAVASQVAIFSAPCTIHQSIMSATTSTVSVKGTLNLPQSGTATSTSAKNSRPPCLGRCRLRRSWEL